jgi:hypothetical protein
MRITMRTTSTLLLLCLTAGVSLQDPKPAPQTAPQQDPQQDPQQNPQQDPQPGAKPAPKPAGQQPARTEASQKPIPGKPKRHPYEGVYKLTRRVINGIPDAKPSKGYLALTGRHLFLNLASSGPEEQHPLVHSAVREWREVRDGMRTTARLDWFTDSEGDLHFAADGKQEVRRIEPIHGGLRVMQGLRTYLEFERIE